MTTMIDDRCLRRPTRRDVLKTGLAATGALLVPSGLVQAQDAAPVASPAALTDEQRGWLERASRTDVNGWVHLRIEGAAFERGFQHGYLIFMTTHFQINSR